MIQYQEFHDHPKSKYLLANINNGLWSVGNYPDAEKRVAPFNSIQDFCGFTRGYDPSAPQMKGYLGDASDAALAALHKLEDDEALRLVLDGSQTVVADNNADYTVENIHGLSDGDLQELYGDENAPVPDESEVDNLPVRAPLCARGPRRAHRRSCSDAARVRTARNPLDRQGRTGRRPGRGSRRAHSSGIATEAIWRAPAFPSAGAIPQTDATIR